MPGTFLTPSRHKQMTNNFQEMGSEVLQYLNGEGMLIPNMGWEIGR